MRGIIILVCWCY